MSTYRLYDRGKLVGEFTAQQIKKKIGCCGQTICKYEQTGKAWEDRWTIEYQEKPVRMGKWKVFWAEEWEKETKKWKNSGRDLAKIRITGKDPDE